MSNDFKLTEKQRQLASDNHNLIYAYAHSKNLSLDDYYDILATGLCKAARSFDESKGKFSTFCYRCMQNEMNTYWRSQNSKSSVPQSALLYYNATVNNQDHNNDYSNMLLDNDGYESMWYGIILDEFMESLTNVEKTVAKMLMSGMIHNDIAKELSCTRQNIDYHVKVIKNKLLNYINN